MESDREATGDVVEQPDECIDLVEGDVVIGSGSVAAPADVVAGQLSELIERVEEVLEDEGLLPPPCGS